MTPYVKSRAEEFIPSTLATITYQDKQAGRPAQTNAGFLSYRTDQVDKVPGDVTGGQLTSPPRTTASPTRGRPAGGAPAPPPRGRRGRARAGCR